jgi:adenine-specific DNA methylase
MRLPWAGAGQTLTGLGGYWKGRKPLILVRAVVLGLLLPSSNDPDRDRAIFLKLMLMDEAGLLKRRKPFNGQMAARVAGLLSESSWSRAISRIGDDYIWTPRLERNERQAVEVEAFLAMGLDERLRHCVRPEELPASVLDDAWDEVNRHLGTDVGSVAALIEELGTRRFGQRARIGDPFCGGGSVPFEAARIGCDVYASDLNPIACLLTWGALNIVGGTEEVRHRIAAAQNLIVRKVDYEITNLGIEHDGGDSDLRLPADAPTRWPHGWRVTRGGQPVAPTQAHYNVTCPCSGWRVPMLESLQVSERHSVVLRLVPDAAAREYRIEPLVGVDADTWKSAASGTVEREDGSLFLVHTPEPDVPDTRFRVRIANRAKSYLYCLEVIDPNTGWWVPLAPSWVISRNYRTVARLVPDSDAKRFDIEVTMEADDEALERATRGTVDGNDLRVVIDGHEHRTSIERLRGEVRLKARYRDASEEMRDRDRFLACRNRYAPTAGNDLRPWEIDDVTPRSDDAFQERLYAVQWLTPDGNLFFTPARTEDIAREKQVEATVRENLSSWQKLGLVPDSRIEPGDETSRLMRERGWTIGTIYSCPVIYGSAPKFVQP